MTRNKFSIPICILLQRVFRLFFITNLMLIERKGCGGFFFFAGDETGMHFSRLKGEPYFYEFVHSHKTHIP